MKRIVHIHLAGGVDAPSLFPDGGVDITKLHPAATNLKILAEHGMVHAVLCTGPDNPNGSHFNMIRAQQDRSADPNDMTGEGWGDYALAQTFPNAEGVIGVAVGDSALPRVLQGGHANCVAVRTNISTPDGVTELFEAAKNDESLPDFLRDIYLTSVANSAEIGGFSLEFGSLGKTMAEVLAEQASIKFVSGWLGGFDTHTDHDKQFATSLSIFDSTLGEFARSAGWLAIPDGDGEHFNGPVLDDPANDDDVLMIVTTDFSRDLIKTSGGGYSHGRGGFVLVIGRGVRGGFTGSLPRLGDPRLLADGFASGRFLPVDYPTPRVVLALLEHAGWNTDGLFTKQYEPLPDMFLVVKEPNEPEEPAIKEPVRTRRVAILGELRALLDELEAVTA